MKESSVDDDKGPENKEKEQQEKRAPTEEDLQRSLAILEATKGQMEALAKEADMIHSSLRDHSRAKETLEALKKMKNPTEMLIPLGGGILLQAKPTTSKNILMSIGSDITVEYSVDEALEKLEKVVKDLEDKEKMVVSELRKMEISAEALTHELQAMYATIQKANG